MPGFQGLEEESALRAVTAYVLHLGGRPIPDFLREGQPPLSIADSPGEEHPHRGEQDANDGSDPQLIEPIGTTP